MKLTDVDVEAIDEERMEGEGGHRVPPLESSPMSKSVEYPPAPLMTPKTQTGEEDEWPDETVEGAREVETPRMIREHKHAGCTCNHPGECPDECPPSCQCPTHTRSEPTYNISGDEP